MKGVLYSRGECNKPVAIVCKMIKILFDRGVWMRQGRETFLVGRKRPIGSLRFRKSS